MTKRKIIRSTIIIGMILMALITQNNVYAAPINEETHTMYFTSNEIKIFHFGVENIGVSITEVTDVIVRYKITYPTYIKRASSAPITIKIQNINLVWHLKANGYNLITKKVPLTLGEENSAFITGLTLTPISSHVKVDISAVFMNPIIELQIKNPNGSSRIIDIDDNIKTFYINPTKSGISIKITPVLKMRQSFRLTLHLILLSKNFEFKPTFIEMPSYSNVNINIPLAPLVKINSNPSSGSVYIDENFAGDTPITIEVTPGTHVITIKKEEYKEFKKTIVANPGDVIKLNANLKALYGPLTITTNPEGARVFVDGEYVGNSPIKNLKLQPGTHTLRIVKEGYKEIRKNITIIAGKNIALSESLEKIMEHTTTTKSHSRKICGPGLIVLLSTATILIIKRKK